MKNKVSYKIAFTIIELLVTITIIGILSGLIVVSIKGYVNSANDTKRKQGIDSIRKVVMVYGALNFGTYPTEEAGCYIAPTGVTNRCTNLPTLIPDLVNPPTDPTTGTYYTYVSTGSSFTISSILSTGFSYGYNSTSANYHSSIFARLPMYNNKTSIYGGEACWTAVTDSTSSLGSVFSYTCGWNAITRIGSAYGFQAGKYDMYVRTRASITSSISGGVYNSTAKNYLIQFTLPNVKNTYQVLYAGRITLTTTILAQSVSTYFAPSGGATDYIDYIEFRYVP